jgi:hypothetical protein
VATATQPQQPATAVTEHAIAIEPPTPRSRRRLLPLIVLAAGALV